MSTEEAKRALPKIVGFFKAFELQPLIKGSPIAQSLSAKEPKFAKFLGWELGELLKSPKDFGISLEDAAISLQMIALKNYVPFANLTHAGLLTRALQKNESTRKAVFSGLRDGFAAIGLSGMSPLIGLLGLGALKARRLKSKALEQARAEIEAHEKAIDEGKYKGTDEQQKTLGDVDVGKLCTREDTGSADSYRGGP